MAMWFEALNLALTLVAARAAHKLLWERARPKAAPEPELSSDEQEGLLVAMGFPADQAHHLVETFEHRHEAVVEAPAEEIAPAPSKLDALMQSTEAMIEQTKTPPEPPRGGRSADAFIDLVNSIDRRLLAQDVDDVPFSSVGLDQLGAFEEYVQHLRGEAIMRHLPSGTIMRMPEDQLRCIGENLVPMEDVLRQMRGEPPRRRRP